MVEDKPVALFDEVTDATRNAIIMQHLVALIHIDRIVAVPEIAPVHVSLGPPGVGHPIRDGRNDNGEGGSLSSGCLVLLDQIDEALEKKVTILRAGCSLGVMLHAEHGAVLQGDAGV
jgi:hypothetical protein